ncbi:prtase-like protein [Phaffia rhodozyma]|uniref:Prtase-like protein n=1 Tax=Phaffia rhodozyma TaxID=264483 RepID=A0A0F7SFV3_PHARH|nr:prtase-like protein [Phaffia rhodozyma]
MGGPAVKGAIGDGRVRVTYNDIHILIGNAAERVKKDFNPDVMIAIGGGGFFPARVMRTFLKCSTRKTNIPIQAIGLSLYESLPSTTAEQLGTEVVRTQWLDFSTLGAAGASGLLGKKILVVDEVDDSRTTLSYAITELQKDIAKLEAQLTDEQRKVTPPTQLGIFVVHNKLKTKAAEIPGDVAYFSGADIEDHWIEYPWEMPDIKDHDRLAYGEPTRVEPTATYFGDA